MKNLLNISKAWQRVMAVMALFFIQGIALAQDKGIDVNLSVDKGESQWYTEPWMWAVGAAVFIIIIVAIIRGNSK